MFAMRDDNDKHKEDGEEEGEVSEESLDEMMDEDDDDSDDFPGEGEEDEKAWE